MKTMWLIVFIISILSCGITGYISIEDIVNESNNWDTGDGPDIYLYEPTIIWSYPGVAPEIDTQIDSFYSRLFYQKEYGSNTTGNLIDQTEFFYYVDDISDFSHAETRDPNENDIKFSGTPILFSGHGTYYIIRIKARIFLENEYYWSNTKSCRIAISYGDVQITSSLPEGTYTGPQTTTLIADPATSTIEWRINGHDWQTYVGPISLVDIVNPSETSIVVNIKADHPDRNHTVDTLYYTIN